MLFAGSCWWLNKKMHSFEILTKSGTLDFEWRGWSKDVLGFEIFYSGFFGGRKIWQVFFWWLYLSRDFLGVQSNLKIFRIYQMRKRQLQMVWWINTHKHSISNVFIFHLISFLNAFWKFLRPGNSAWDFSGVIIFGSGIFWDFEFCPYAIVTVTWNPEYLDPLRLTLGSSKLSSL